uniref:Uncharacterized protein n=1 Tax=Rousettus aegyptiacus TaxID=9407 RepID=A0A7J8CIW9_ROUAE|nr:hypothetical protein HJG63_009248 [Rousettus aegyptiacus]
MGPQPLAVECYQSWPVRNWASQQEASSRCAREASSAFAAAPQLRSLVPQRLGTTSLDHLRPVQDDCTSGSGWLRTPPGVHEAGVMLRTQVAGDWAAWSPTGTGRGERRVQANESAGSAACGRAQRRQDGAAPPSCAGRWEEAPHGDSGGRPSGPRPEATQPRLSPHVPRASRVAAPTPEHRVSVLLRGRLALRLSSSLAAVPAGFHSRACGDFCPRHWTPGWGPRCGAGPLAPPPVTGTPGRGLACSGRRSCRAQVASSACPAAGLSRRPQAVLGDGGLVVWF